MVRTFLRRRLKLVFVKNIFDPSGFTFTGFDTRFEQPLVLKSNLAVKKFEFFAFRPMHQIRNFMKEKVSDPQGSTKNGS